MPSDEAPTHARRDILAGAAALAACGFMSNAEADDGTEAILSVIERYADECRKWLDTHVPEHKLSSRSAQAHGHEGIFRQLALTALSARLRIESDLQKKQGRP